MRRYAARADGNQPAIVQALRRIGASVCPTHTAGQGFPDLVVAFRGRTVLLEVKDPSKPLSDQRLTPAQKVFHEAWTGELYVVFTPEQAIEAVTQTNKELS